MRIRIVFICCNTESKKMEYGSKQYNKLQKEAEALIERSKAMTDDDLAEHIAKHRTAFTAEVDEALVKKEIIHPGSKNYVPLKAGTRVRFHFVTQKLDGTVLDDSRKSGTPMELVLGKQFKLAVWECILHKMALNEIAKFTVDRSLVTQYPFVSKVIRDRDNKARSEAPRHVCGMTIQNEGLGYKDLDALFAEPCHLEFIIELISIENPGTWDKEAWQMDDKEKLKRIKELREKGNEAYKKKDFHNAEGHYTFAIGLLEQLMLKEKPHDTEWNELALLKVPLLLNYSQVKLLNKEYYEVITHCTEVVGLDKDNVKAYYRRAKAATGTWNETLARADYAKCIELDPNLQTIVEKELKEFEHRLKVREAEEKLKFQKLF